MTNDSEFEQVYETVMRERGGEPVPAGLEQRLLARLAREERDELSPPAPAPRWFTLPQQASLLGHVSSLWFAMGVHVAALAIVALLMAKHVQIVAPVRPQVSVSLLAPVPPPAVPRSAAAGGGGGHPDVAPASQGRAPKVALTQIVPPKAPPTVPPKLAIEPTVVMQKSIQIADNSMPNLGLPNSTLRGVSMGSGSGTGIGSGDGAGVGNGSGSGTGGGVMHIGGGVKAPVPIYQPEAVYSEEARKAKFSGNVEVYLWVDENGNPSHIRVARSVGMGLDEKAIEAVRQYKFRPATQNGRPVKVDLYIDVDFQIL